MIKSLVINNLLSLSKKNKKKFLILTNIAISFVIAAIITSFVSIYYENKLIKLRKDLIDLNYDQMTTQEWLIDTGLLLNRNDEYDFIYNLGGFKTGKFYNLSESRYFFHILSWTPITVQLALSDAKSLGLNNELFTSSELIEIKKRYSIIDRYYNDVSYLKKYNLKEFSIEEMENITNEIYKYVLNIHENLSYYSDPNTKNIIKDEKYFSSNRDILITIQHQISKLAVITEVLNRLYKKKNIVISKKIFNIEKKILKATATSANTILYAFLLQVIIFLVIQIFEVREVK
tara:strand:+ start:370 stop:1236 length:867 start_codon:yes stop_codon:yes gene_type:complete